MDSQTQVKAFISSYLENLLSIKISETTDPLILDLEKILIPLVLRSPNYFTETKPRPLFATASGNLQKHFDPKSELIGYLNQLVNWVSSVIDDSEKWESIINVERLYTLLKNAETIEEAYLTMHEYRDKYDQINSELGFDDDAPHGPH